MSEIFPAIPSPWDESAKRRSQRLLEDEVYGAWSVPDSCLVVRRTTVNDHREILQVPFIILCALPDSAGPWPTLIGLNFDGLHTLEDDPSYTEPSGWTYTEKFARGTRSDTWPLDRITHRGWAVATSFVGEIEPDTPELSAGCAISTWARGLATIMEVLRKDPRFDQNRMVAVGHSRLGKAALWAAANHSGFAGVVSLQSGCGGAGPSRTTVGETVRDITMRFPHWFSPKFATYSDDPGRLPLDQHWLLALCASKPTLLCNASMDEWANPFGQHEMLKRAGTVYGEELPDMVTGQTVGRRLGHFYRNGRHEVISEDWSAILTWLETWFA